MNKVLKYFLFFFTFSCISNNNDVEIIEKKSDRKGLNKFQSNYGYYQYLELDSIHNDKLKFDSFRPVFYTNVRPMNGKPEFPEQVLDWSNRFPKSRKYFYNNLEGKLLTFIEKDNNIIYRSFLQSYYGKKYFTKDINKPRNIENLIEYFKNKKIEFKILDTINILNTTANSHIDNKEKKAIFQKLIKSKTYDIIVNEKFYRITLDSSFVESRLFYNPKDTINAETFNTQIIHTF